MIPAAHTCCVCVQIFPALYHTSCSQDVYGCPDCMIRLEHGWQNEWSGFGTLNLLGKPHWVLGECETRMMQSITLSIVPSFLFSLPLDSTSTGRTEHKTLSAIDLPLSSLAVPLLSPSTLLEKAVLRSYRHYRINERMSGGQRLLSRIQISTLAGRVRKGKHQALDSCIIVLHCLHI